VEEKFIEFAIKALICRSHGLLSHTARRNPGKNGIGGGKGGVLEQ
jgi:hypothetical protein